MTSLFAVSHGETIGQWCITVAYSKIAENRYIRNIGQMRNQVILEIWERNKKNVVVFVVNSASRVPLMVERNISPSRLKTSNKMNLTNLTNLVWYTGSDWTLQYKSKTTKKMNHFAKQVNVLSGLVIFWTKNLIFFPF